MAVLRAIIEEFIATNEPVASKSLVEKHNFGVSSATIRNDMAFLEEEGYIAAPHTSSGRVPTDKGYRAFVDQLTQVEQVATEVRKNLTDLKRLFSKTLDQLTDLDEKLHTSAQLLAKATGEAAVVQYPNMQVVLISSLELIKVADNRILVLLITDAQRIQQHVVALKENISDDDLNLFRLKLNEECAGKTMEVLTEKLPKLSGQFSPKLKSTVEPLLSSIRMLVDVNKQDKVAFAGSSNLIRNESQFAGGLESLLKTFDEQSDIWQVLNLLPLESSRPRAIIGSENTVLELSTSSLLLSSYSNQGTEVAKVAVVGPTRMNYSKNLAAVLALSNSLSNETEA